VGFNFFGIGKKPTKKAKRQPTAEQLSNIAELKRKRFVAQAYVDMAIQDPELKRQMVADEYKLKLPPKDPAGEQRKEMEALISSLVMKEIRENPELAKRVVDSRIAQLTNQEAMVTGDEGEASYPGSAIGQVLDEMENLEELKSRLGSGKGSGWGDLFKDPGVIANLLSTAQAIIRGVSPQGTEPAVIVEIDGQMVSVPQSQFKKLQEEGRVKPVAMVESPKPGKDPQVDKATPKLTAQDTPPESTGDGVAENAEAPADDGSPLPFPFSLVDLAELASCLDQTPADAVEQLKAKRLEGLAYAQVLWAILEIADPAALVAKAISYKGHAKLGPYAELIASEKGREWLEEFLRLLRQRDDKD
jgi:hypothetical protein